MRDTGCPRFSALATIKAFSSADTGKVTRRDRGVATLRFGRLFFGFLLRVVDAGLLRTAANCSARFFALRSPRC